MSLAVFAGSDPGLALATGDLDVWLAAHPCSCPPDALVCSCLDPPQGGVDAVTRPDYASGR